MSVNDLHPLRAALLGAGAWARVLAKAAAGSPKFEFVSCWSRTPERLHAFAQETGIAASPDLEHIWQDQEIEAVVIALPNDQHYAFAALAARHGRHVFIEKPIADTLEAGLQTAALEEAHRVRIVVGHCARLLAGNRLLGEAARRGELGRVTQIEANFSTARGLTLTPQDWRWYEAGAPGGPLSQIAIHQFDTLRALGGDIRAVSARCARHSPVGAEVQDQWIVTVEFVDGKLGTVLSSWTSPGTYSVRMTGDAAVMFYEINQAHWPTAERLHEDATLYIQLRGQGPRDRKVLDVPPSNMFREELGLFADAVRSGAPCALSTDNACRALAAVEAALISARSGGAVVQLDGVLEAARSRIAAAGAPRDDRLQSIGLK